MVRVRRSSRKIAIFLTSTYSARQTSLQNVPELYDRWILIARLAFREIHEVVYPKQYIDFSTWRCSDSHTTLPFFYAYLFSRHVLDAKRACMFHSAKRACGMSSRRTGASRHHETTHFTIILTPSYTMRTVFAGRTSPPMVDWVSNWHVLSVTPLYATKWLKWHHVKASCMFRYLYISTETRKKKTRSWITRPACFVFTFFYL